MKLKSISYKINNHKLRNNKSPVINPFFIILFIFRTNKDTVIIHQKAILPETLKARPDNRQ